MRLVCTTCCRLQASPHRSRGRACSRGTCLTTSVHIDSIPKHIFLVHRLTPGCGPDAPRFPQKWPVSADSALACGNRACMLLPHSSGPSSGSKIHCILVSSPPQGRKQDRFTPCTGGQKLAVLVRGQTLFFDIARPSIKVIA